MASESPKLVLQVRPSRSPGPPCPGSRSRPAPEDDRGRDGRSPWELHGWAWSILAHALLLLILGLWYFARKPSQVRTFDTRLAGSEFGVEEGMTTLGGLDTPVAMPELAPLGPDPESTFARLQPTEIAPNPLAGFQGNTGNPGAGQGDGFGLAKFGNGGEKVRGVEVKVGDPQFTLLWDSKADIDLHVIEPGGKEIFWNDPKGKLGGELDVDNVEGFGPENIYWLKVRPTTARRNSAPARPASTAGSSTTTAATAASPSRPAGRSGSSTRAGSRSSRAGSPSPAPEQDLHPDRRRPPARPRATMPDFKPVGASRWPRPSPA